MPLKQIVLFKILNMQPETANDSVISCSIYLKKILPSLLFKNGQFGVTAKNNVFVFFYIENSGFSLSISCTWMKFLFFFSPRWESHRAGCGPPAGAEGAGRGVHLSSEACGSVSQQRQDFLDCELNAWLLSQTSRERRTSHTRTRSQSSIVAIIITFLPLCSLLLYLFLSQRSPTSLATFKAIEYSTAPSAAPGPSWTLKQRPTTAPRWWICTPAPSTRSRSVLTSTSCRVETA